MTLVEALVGIVVLAIVSVAAAGLFKAGIRSSVYTLRQTAFLTGARKGLLGEAGRHGLVWTSQESASAADLSTGTLTLGQAAGSAVSFRLQQGRLLRSQVGVDSVQAGDISRLSVAYYNLDDAGLVIESTAAAGAAFVTFELGVSRDGSPEQRFFSGARLRNR